jgi:large subunit ribosomal protein L24
MSQKQPTTSKSKLKSNFKRGDKVIVIAGSDKGKTGSVIEVLLEKQRVIIEDVNLVKKHRKPTQTTPGGIIDMPAPIHMSNVMHVDPKSGERTRIGRRDEDGKNVRYSKKSQQIIK